MRGCDPQPGAYATYKGKRVRFYDAKMNPSEMKKQAGEIVLIEEKALQIAVKGGVIQVGKLRVDKGEKIGPIEFTQSIGLKAGDRFGE
jgi:methionyl-tRNA formyltransferase